MTPEERYEDINVLTEGFKVNRHIIRNLIMKHIEEAADEAYDGANKDFDWLQSAVGKVYWNLTDGKLSKWNTDPQALIAEVEDVQNKLIEELVAAERERCAKVAENYVEEAMGAEVEQWELGLCRKIAKAIRGGNGS